MPLAFSTNAFTRFSLDDALAGIAQAGFALVEILADAPHADPGTGADPVRLGQALRPRLAALRLGVCNVNCNCSFSYWRHAPPEAYFEPSLISPVDQHRFDRAQRVRWAVEFAAAVGAPAVSITSGRCLGGVPPDRAGHLLRESLLPLLDHADRHGVNLGIECEPGLYIEYASELADLIADLGHPRLGANLDVGHSHVLGESIPDAFRLLRGRIWNLHIEDLPGRKHYHTIPGRGTFPWPTLLDAVRATTYAGPATVELYTETADPHTAARESHAFLGPLFAGL
jgi:fructoselysine 3-epimerase